MKGTQQTDSMRALARRRALETLDRRLGEGDGPSDALDALFARDPRRAELGARAVMSRIGQARKPGRAGMRVAYVLAAAVALAAVSSLLTLALAGGRQTIEVRFVLSAPDAASVALAADFNGWSVDSHELARRPDGTWEIVVPLRKGKAYLYSFVVDGERWIPDPRSSVILDDGFGGSSSSISL